MTCKEYAREVADRLHATIDYSDYTALRDAIDEIDTLEERDRQIEDLWASFKDVPMDPGTECIKERFLDFKPGTEREEIWHWFDERYSKGVAYLLYGEVEDYVGETRRLYRLKKLCAECESSSCRFNYRGECRFAMVYERKPRITDFDGCIDYDYSEMDDV